MTEDTLKKLVESAKRKCKITWESSDTENEIKEIVEDAVIAMKDKLGMKADADAEVFLVSGNARKLWKEYCLYCWNGVADEFDKVYLSEIMQERRKNEVKQYAEKKAEQLQ